jgi:hypothetical protein
MIRGHMPYTRSVVRCHGAAARSEPVPASVLGGGRIQVWRQRCFAELARSSCCRRIAERLDGIATNLGGRSAANERHMLVYRGDLKQALATSPRYSSCPGVSAKTVAVRRRTGSCASCRPPPPLSCSGQTEIRQGRYGGSHGKRCSERISWAAATNDVAANGCVDTYRASVPDEYAIRLNQLCRPTMPASCMIQERRGECWRADVGSLRA